MTRSTPARANGISKSKVTVTTLFALGASHDKTKSFFALPTQQPRMVEIALLVRIVTS